MSHFKKFLADRNALRINESNNVVDMTLATDREPEEDTPYLMTADALQETGYEETAKYIRFVIKEHHVAKIANYEKYSTMAFIEIKNKAPEVGLEVSSATKSGDNKIIFYNLKDKKGTLPQPVGTIENYMIVIGHDIKTFLRLVNLETTDLTSNTYSRPADFAKFLSSVDYEKQNLLCAAAMFLAVKNHTGVESGSRITGNLLKELQYLATYDPGRTVNQNAIIQIANMSQEIWIAFKKIESHYPEKKKEAAQIIRSVLMASRWKRCLQGRAVNMPMYCAHFLRIREILEQNP